MKRFDDIIWKTWQICDSEKRWLNPSLNLNLNPSLNLNLPRQLISPQPPKDITPHHPKAKRGSGQFGPADNQHCGCGEARSQPRAAFPDHSLLLAMDYRVDYLVHNRLGGQALEITNSSIFDKKKLDDPTQLILMFEVTDLVGIVSLLYGMLLHSAAPSHRDMAPCELSNHMAVLDLSVLPRALGEEGMWLEFTHMASYLILYSSHHLCEDLLHMASYLILYSSHHLCEDLLHQVILCLGYFTLLHPDNQVTPPFFFPFFF
ncbi:hypothetical protein ACOMHN_011963 [Nucella lapillus]